MKKGKTRTEWVRCITDEWNTSCGGMREAIFAIGNDLIQAKDELEHGEFIPMIENDLPFTKRTAQMFMTIARDPRLTKAKTSSHLPPYWNTLYKITRLEDEAFERLIDDGTISPECTYAEINKALRSEKIKADESEVLRLKPKPGKYRTIVIDPAWDYEGLSLGARAAPTYALQSLESLRTLDLTQWADDTCHLYCWATNNFLGEACKLIEGWGFQYRVPITWVKSGAFGMGSYFRHSTEHVLFATLGDTTTRKAAASIPTHFTAARGEHSEKPEEFYDIVRKASYPPFAEGNQRKSRPDFTPLWVAETGEKVA